MRADNPVKEGNFMRRPIRPSTFIFSVMAIMLSFLILPAFKVCAAEPEFSEIASVGLSSPGPAPDIVTFINGNVNEAINTTTIQDNIDVLISATEGVLKDSFDDCYKVERGDKLVTISIWSDGIAYSSVYASKDKGYRQDWESLLGSIQGMSQTIYDVYKPYGYSVAVNVLNDLNKDNVLVSYLNGVLVYDTVSSADL